ncbi:unnamed protein product [Merluccius merluccius]
MDASERIVIISSNLPWPSGLAVDYETKRLYWADAGIEVIETDIRRISFDTEDMSDDVIPLADVRNAVALDRDSKEGYVYWTEVTTDSINRALWSARGQSGLAVDYETKRLYWADAGIEVIETDIRRISFNTEDMSDDVIPLADVRNAVALDRDSKEGYVYWTEVTTDSINRALWSARGQSGLAVDYETKRLYWADAASRTDIRRISFDTEDMSDDVIPLADVRNAVALDRDSKEGYVYWTEVTTDSINRALWSARGQSGLAVDYETKRLYWADAGIEVIETDIRRISFDTEDMSDDVIPLADVRNAVALDRDSKEGYVYWTEVTTDSINRALWSARGQSGLAVDYETKRLYWADAGIEVIETDIRRISFDTEDMSDDVIPLADVRNAVALDRDSKEGYVYWTEVTTDSINRALWSARGQSGLAVDYETKRLYWADAGIEVIETDIRRISFDTEDMSDDVIPLADVRNAVALDRDSKEGYVYWTEVTTDSINRALWSARGQSGLAVDYETKRLYWADAGIEVIEYGDFDGTDRQAKCIGPTVSRDNMDGSEHWTDDDRRTICWTDTGTNRIDVADMDGSTCKVLIWQNLDGPRAIARYSEMG